MPEFLLEMYVAASAAALVGDDVEQVRHASEELASLGVHARFVRSIPVPTDETCFVLVEADSAETVVRLADLARVRVNRISRVAARTP